MNNVLVVYGKNHIEIKHIRKTLGISYKSNGSGVYYYNNPTWKPAKLSISTLRSLHVNLVEIPLENLSEIVLLLKLGMTEQDVIDFLNTKPLR